MCGLFGFAGTTPNIDLLRDIALDVSVRGPDACGLFYNNPRAPYESLKYTVEKRAGSFEKNLSLLPPAQHSTLIMGHARMASMPGDPAELANAQPIQYGSVIVAHNGNVWEWDRKAAERKFKLRTKCDSELIAQWIAHDDRNLLASTRISDAIGDLELERFALLLVVNDQLFLACNGLPIYYAEYANGCYVSSKPIDPWLEKAHEYRKFRGAGRLPDWRLFTTEGSLGLCLPLAARKRVPYPVW